MRRVQQARAVQAHRSQTEREQPGYMLCASHCAQKNNSIASQRCSHGEALHDLHRSLRHRVKINVQLMCMTAVLLKAYDTIMHMGRVSWSI
jgi:hypothetical protein